MPEIDEIDEMMARAHDREEAAQRGEPDPWDATDDAIDFALFRLDRIGCFQVVREALARAGYVIVPSDEQLLAKGRESGVKLTTPFDTAISEETKAALAAIDKDTKYGL